MDRAQFAREWFDLSQQMRDQLQIIRTEVVFLGRLKPDAPGPPNIDVAASKLRALVERAERIVEGYVASADSGRINVRG